MTAFDFVMIGLVLVSVAISIWRGLVREVVSLLSWLVALWVAARFSVVFSDWLAAAITNPPVRYITAFVALFLGTIVVLELLGMLLGRLLHTV
ncbi:MAG: CvpA family protein, partial [Acidobacteriota bacterium]